MAYFSDNLNALPGLAHAFDEACDTRTPAGLFYCAQKHGANVIEVGDEQLAGIIAGDAVFTRTTRPIGIVTADCLPILIGSTTDQFVAAIHGGWQGLTAGIIENSFNAFRLAGISLDNLQVAIGPAIQTCCYEVGSALADKIEQVHGYLWRGRQAPWSTTREMSGMTSNFRQAPASHGEAWFDLTLYCLYLLEASGVDRAQVQTAGVCTYCAGQNWGSYRRRTHRVEEKTYQYSWICLGDVDA
ncbi:polyphenol oxidase family protein [Pseudomonas putida]|jgi:YfiH family protein|uniref:polyphenol oxidase family protein n=1 Tax=Pseudomonas putida TaxID=303 RepID=UPI0023632BE5|nr:polyphenol oxidase family protein [Pseudomonas putida]MDD2103668.1 polyphenol oxidase family protein [Pseudomonas putida]